MFLLLLPLTGCYLQELVDTATPRDCPERSLFYVDADGDGVGDETQKIIACEQPSGAVTEAGDCDDTDAALQDDCGPEPSALCEGAGSASTAENTFSNVDFPECPDPLVAPTLSYPAPETERYALFLGCVVETGCQEGDRSALELACAAQAAYGEDAEGTQVTPDAPESLAFALSDPHALLPALSPDAELGVLLFGEGDQRWAAVYDADFALQVGWVDADTSFEPPQDLKTAVGIGELPLFGALLLQDDQEVCDWDDDTQRGRDLGLSATLGESQATLGPLAWTDLDTLRLHSGDLRLSLDGDNARTLLVTGLD